MCRCRDPFCSLVTGSKPMMCQYQRKIIKWVSGKIVLHFSARFRNSTKNKSLIIRQNLLQQRGGEPFDRNELVKRYEVIENLGEAAIKLNPNP